MMMKRILFLSLCAFIFGNCTEIAPVVPALGDRKVLVEEFTGVRCVNCPAGASELENLAAIYGERLVVVSVHAGDFAPPFSDSRFDFRTPEGDALEKRLGAPLGYPTAVINRKKFSGQTGLQVGRSLWAGLIASESNAASAVSLSFDKTYNSMTRQFQMTIKAVENTKDALKNVVFSAMITEDNILDTQETPSGRQSNYKHRHIFRGFAADEVAVNPTGAAQISYSFNATLKPNWLVENCSIVLVLSQKNGDTKDVLQVAESKIKL
jgi:thiol-disulfide isomerase/thioredoxin